VESEGQSLNKFLKSLKDGRIRVHNDHNSRQTWDVSPQSLSAIESRYAEENPGSWPLNLGKLVVSQQSEPPKNLTWLHLASCGGKFYTDRCTKPPRLNCWSVFSFKENCLLERQLKVLCWVPNFQWQERCYDSFGLSLTYLDKKQDSDCKPQRCNEKDIRLLQKTSNHTPEQQETVNSSNKTVNWCFIVSWSMMSINGTYLIRSCCISLSFGWRINLGIFSASVLGFFSAFLRLQYQ